MAIKKSQIEDKSAYAKAPVDKAIKPDKETENNLFEKKEDKKERGKEYNYPEHNVTVKAKNKKEADKKLNELKN